MSKVKQALHDRRTNKTISADHQHPHSPILTLLGPACREEQSVKRFDGLTHLLIGAGFNAAFAVGDIFFLGPAEQTGRAERTSGAGRSFRRDRQERRCPRLQKHSLRCAARRGASLEGAAAGGPLAGRSCRDRVTKCLLANSVSPTVRLSGKPSPP